MRKQLQRGLPLVKHPYELLAQQLNCSEADVLSAVEQLRNEGLIKRLGLVVHHHELGYVHNGMVVWDVADDQVDVVAKSLAKEDKITLCYRRPRRDGWPYNLFCMIHGKNRQQVQALLADIADRHGLEHIARDILFSTQRFKQRVSSGRGV